jgi:hypothetical protein
VPRSVSASGLARALACALAAIGCASPDARGRAGIHDYEMRERVGRVALGQSFAEAHAILGRDPVHRPGHPDQPYPSPLRSLALRPPAGEPVQIELYVVAARRAEGCPDVHYEDVPVAYRGGVVAARDWRAVEASWRGWGGSLAELRAARDGLRCSEAP